MSEQAAGRVVVVGSVNEDLTVPVERLPRPGETVPGGDPAYGCGGKGANQAVAAARSGAGVRMVGCVGADPAGDRLLACLDGAGVDAAGVRRVAGPSGLALVAVAEDGENTVIVTPGANAACTAQVVAAGLADLTAADVVVTQAEIPVPAIAAAAEHARRAGARFVLNLAPPIRLDLAPLHLAALVVNEHELLELDATRATANGPTSAASARRWASRLDTTLVVTLGAEGVLLATATGEAHLPAAPPERVVDTTGAGDAFVGAFAAALARREALVDAVRWGAAAGSIAVASPGAQPRDLSPARLHAVLAQARVGRSE